MKITSRFKVLLAEKELRDRRNYTLRDVARAANVSIYTVTGLANNTLREFPRETLEGVCGFLGCTIGELLVSDRRIDSSDTLEESLSPAESLVQ